MFLWLVVLSCIALFIIGFLAFMQLIEDIKARKAESAYYKRIDKICERKRREYIEHLKKIRSK